MDAYQIHKLRVDLPQEAANYLDSLYLLRLSIDNLNYMLIDEKDIKITPDKDFYNRLRNINAQLAIVTSTTLNLTRQHFEAARSNVNTLPFSVLEFKKEGEDETQTEKSEMQAWEKYLKQLETDIGILHKNMKYIDEKGYAYSNSNILQPYLAEIEVFLNVMVDAIVKTKEEWYSLIHLESFESRSKKLALLLESLRFRLESLNLASESVIDYMRQPSEKDVDFIEMQILEIAQAYEEKIYNPIQEASIYKLHQHPHFAPLNDVLNLAICIKKFGRKALEKQISETFIESDIKTKFPSLLVSSSVTEINYLISKAQEQQIVIDMVNTDKKLFSQDIEEIFTLEERKGLLNRPTNQEKSVFWRLWIVYLLAGLGYIAVKQVKEEKMIKL